MTAKEYLRQYEKAEHRARRYREEYESESLLIDAIRSLSNNDGMPHGSGISRPTEEKALRLVDKRLRLIDAEAEAVQIRQELFDFIDRIDGVEGAILYEKYINLLTWEEVCCKVGYSWAQTHRYHRRALAIVAEKLGIE